MLSSPLVEIRVSEDPFANFAEYISPIVLHVCVGQHYTHFLVGLRTVISSGRRLGAWVLEGRRSASSGRSEQNLRPDTVYCVAAISDTSGVQSTRN